jgi:hypothetical protein
MSDTILGIHSNVRPGMIDPSTGKPTDPSLIDGHGWLTVTRDGVTTTHGLWPDDHPRVVKRGLSNGDGSDVRRGLEDDMAPVASRYYRLTPEQTATLDAKLKENAAWGMTDNCSSWASSTLEAVTGQRVNADEPYTAGVVETPRVLGGSIHRLEQTDRTSREAPTTSPVAKERSSSWLSDASDAQKPANATPALLSPHAQNLLRDSEHHVRQLAERHGLPWNPGMDNTVAAVAQRARADGLTGINHFNVKDGQIRYGQFDGYTLKDGSIDARVAANTPEAVSRDGLAQTDQVMNQQQSIRVAEQATPEMSPPALQRA